MRQKTAFAIFLCAVLAAACAPKKTVKKAPEESPATAGAAASTAPSPESAEANLRGADFVTAPDVEAVRFDYDSYALNDEARKILKKNAEYLEAHRDLDVLAAGNCDERGTIAYNLALGQKRAQAVRDYYIRLGIAAKNIATISYGKEKPNCSESNEDCWAKNRRTETLVRKHPAQKT